MKISNQDHEEITPDASSKDDMNYWKIIVILFVLWFILMQFFDVQITPRFNSGNNKQTTVVVDQNISDITKTVLPEGGVILPVVWGSLGKQMIDVGVIDVEKFESLYAQRGGLHSDDTNLLYGDQNNKIKITEQNSGFLLNIFWALGLANKNSILEDGPMTSQKYGGDASKFASTGGWSLSKGNVMDHYSVHRFITLTKKQQDLVERVSQNIYRPCCGNSVYFPDCNHGMAMLGFLELMASQDVSEKDMYSAALQVNAYWFPDTYITLAQYFEKQGILWSEIDPKEILGSTYSSAQGYRKIRSQVKPAQSKSNGGGCGV